MMVDDNGCVENEVVMVIFIEDDVDLMVFVNNGICDMLGFIIVQVVGGDGIYMLVWIGFESGFV